MYYLESDLPGTLAMQKTFQLRSKGIMADLVVVTEAAGYTGSHIVEHLLRAGYRVRGVAEPKEIFFLLTAYSDCDRFEAVSVEDLGHDDLTDVFRGLYHTQYVQYLLIPSSLFAIDVIAVVLTSLLYAKGQVMKVAKLIMESGSSGTRHILEYARAANVTKVIYTGSFANVLHPYDSWSPIIVTENDWNSQTENDCKKLGLHPWCLYTAGRVIAERELWRFADANPHIDVTSILIGFPFGPYGRGQAPDQYRAGTFAWISELLYGPPGRPMISNAVPFSPNYVHISDVASAHVAALRIGPLDPPRRKRVLLVAGYVLWPEVIAHLNEAMPGVRERLPSSMCGPGPRPMAYAQFEARNARDILGIREYRGWKEAIEDAVKDMLKRESRMQV
ncbi:hypothetical protein BC827DRAFT_1271002 [Russula dissimulans]|nr:hypothetical protein BC827DRAFT_1271002 [Russula dissimulans]